MYFPMSDTSPSNPSTLKLALHLKPPVSCRYVDSDKRDMSLFSKLCMSGLCGGRRYEGAGRSPTLRWSASTVQGFLAPTSVDIPTLIIIQLLDQFCYLRFSYTLEMITIFKKLPKYSVKAIYKDG